MKILRSGLLSFLLVVTAILPQPLIVSAIDSITVTVHAPATTLAESDFAVTLDVSTVTSFDAADFRVNFNPAVLRLDSVTAGLIGGVTIPVVLSKQTSPGVFMVMLNIPGLSGATGSGYLTALHFHVLGSGGQSSSIELTSGTISDTFATEYLIAGVGDTISVSEPITAIPPPTTTPIAITTNLPNPSPSPVPIVTTQNIFFVSASEVVLKGELTSLGNAPQAQVCFEWGADTAYGKVTQIQTLTSPGEFSYDLSGLKPMTEYHYRVKAVGNTTVYSADSKFTTPLFVANDAPSSPVPTTAPPIFPSLTFSTAPVDSSSPVGNTLVPSLSQSPSPVPSSQGWVILAAAGALVLAGIIILVLIKKRPVVPK